MSNLRRIKDFLFSSVIGLAFSACPVLAQGEKFVSLDQTSKSLETIVLVGSGLFVIPTLIIYVLAARESIAGGPRTLDPVIVMSFIELLFVTLSSMLIIGELTHNLIMAITVHLGIFLGILLFRLRVTIQHR